MIAEPGSAEDAEETGILARQIGARWTVLDGYQFSPDYIRQLRNAGLPVLAFDDDGRYPEYSSDVILNQNLGANEAMYGARKPHTKLLLGTEFTLLRPEFLGTFRERATPAQAQRLLICMGASDPDNVTQVILKALTEMSDDIDITVVVGSGNPHYEQLRAATGGLRLVHFEHDPKDMAALMREADMAFSAAGSTCWELAHMGVPMIVTVLASNQEAIANGLADRGAAINLGWHNELSRDRICESVKHLAADRERRRAMSESGRKLVDGRGAERVVEVLQSLS
jgi:UDP-2,4-diacetamido-2,4,6-trideoxy-beta-L-altropyranose hydrolase